MRFQTLKRAFAILVHLRPEHRALDGGAGCRRPLHGAVSSGSALFVRKLLLTIYFHNATMRFEIWYLNQYQTELVDLSICSYEVNTLN